MKNKKLWLLYPVLALLLAFSLAMPVSATDDPVPLPHNFYGSVTIITELASAGTEIEAQGTGVMTTEVNPITTTEEGQYGGPGPTEPKLEVQGYIDEGTPIEFYIGGVRAQCREQGTETWLDTYPWHSGDITELDLRVGEAPVDTIAPTVVSTLPLADATSMAIDVVVSATFSEDIQAGANFGGIAISEATGVSASIDGVTLTIAHDAFAYETSYTVTIPAGAVKDSADNPLAEAKVWSFTVVTEEEAEFDPYIYDTNEDGEFSKAETLAAVNAYLVGTITKNSALEVIKLYFALS